MELRTSLKESKLESKEKEHEQLAVYTKNLEVLYNDMRKVKHDYMDLCRMNQS